MFVVFGTHQLFCNLAGSKIMTGTVFFCSIYIFMIIRYLNFYYVCSLQHAIVKIIDTKYWTISITGYPKSVFYCKTLMNFFCAFGAFFMSFISHENLKLFRRTSVFHGSHFGKHWSTLSLSLLKTVIPLKFLIKFKWSQFITLIRQLLF